MQIESISLSNFKSYAQADIAFQPGVNALIGPNGAGKSTILEAIGFALFNCRGAGHEHRLREGAARGQVTIRFRSSLDDRVYQVERTFNQITTLRYRILDPEINQLVAEGNEDVQTWLARHLRVEPGADLASLFENTIGVPQGTFTAPFLLTAALRKGVFDPLLQVEEYQRTAEKLLATGRLLAKQTADLQAAVARLEGLLAELPSQQSESKALTRDIDIAQQQIAGSASIINAFKQRIAELDSAEATVRLREGNYNTARLELATVQQELHSAERQLAESVEARRLCAEAQADHVKYTQYDAEYRAQTDQRRERDQLREKLNMNTAESAGLVTRQQLMGRELNELQASKNKMRALEPAVARQAKLEQKLLELEQACRELQYAQKQADSARSELDNSLIQVNKLNQQLTAAKEIERDIAESQANCETSQDIITGANAELVRVQTEAEGLQMHTQMLSDETIARCPVCKSELTVAHRVELISQNQQELSNLSQQQAYLMGKIKTERIKLQKLESAIKQYQQELRRLPPESALEQAHAQVEKRRETLDTAQSQVENLAYAPQALREHQVLLASLSDPRREYQLLEERAKREPSLRTEAAALQAQIAARDTETAELRLALERYRDLDVLMLANQQARDALQGNHLLYLTNSRNAEEYEPRERQAGILRGKTDSLLRKLQALESALDAARGSYSAEEHVRIRQEYLAEQNRLTAAQAQLAFKQERLQVVNQLIARLRVNQLELGQKVEELAQSRHAQEVLELIRAWLKEAGPQVTRRLVNRISHEASLIYSDIIGDHTGWLHWGTDYELELEIGGSRRTFRQLSGGEQMIAALALRLALLRHTSAIDIAFFDEPTAHLDPERRDNLADKLTQVKGFSQVFVISHDDTFERSASKYIRIAKGENGSYLEDRL